MFQQGNDSFFRSKSFSSNFFFHFFLQFLQTTSISIAWSLFLKCSWVNWYVELNETMQGWSISKLEATMAIPNSCKFMCIWASSSLLINFTSIIEEFLSHHTAWTTPNPALFIKEVPIRPLIFLKSLCYYDGSLNAG